MKIGIIGAGKMGRALAEGLLGKKFEISALGRGGGTIEGVFPASASNELLACDAVIICVKPADVAQACSQLRKSVMETGLHPLFISVAAGRSLKQIESWLGKEKIARAMPNIAAKVGRSSTFYCVNFRADGEDVKTVETILEAVGTCTLAKETDFDAITALAGCGPAYFLNFALKLSQAGERVGLDAGVSRRVARELLCATGALINSSSEPVEKLVGEVATPGGITQTALESLDRNGFENMLAQALFDARKKSAEIAGS